MTQIARDLPTFFQNSDIFGYAASSFVLATFCMKRMVPLRTIAICSNVAFLIYGIILHLMPIVILHSLLVPINAVRLSQVLSVKSANSRSGCADRHVSKILALLRK